MEDTGLTSLEQLGNAELLEILRRQGFRLSPTLTKFRLLYLINSGEPPLQEEVSGTVFSRARLEKWIASEWAMINSQLPCKGVNMGKCSIYNCSDSRHLTCYLKAQEYLI